MRASLAVPAAAGRILVPAIKGVFAPGLGEEGEGGFELILFSLHTVNWRISQKVYLVGTALLGCFVFFRVLRTCSDLLVPTFRRRNPILVYYLVLKKTLGIQTVVRSPGRVILAPVSGTYLIRSAALTSLPNWVPGIGYVVRLRWCSNRCLFSV